MRYVALDVEKKRMALGIISFSKKGREGQQSRECPLDSKRITFSFSSCRPSSSLLSSWLPWGIHRTHYCRVVYNDAGKKLIGKNIFFNLFRKNYFRAGPIGLYAARNDFLMKIFLVTGTHSNENRFARPVASALSKLFSKNNHPVVRIPLPSPVTQRRKLGIQDGWLDGRDVSAASAYAHLVSTHGYDPQNPDHVVLDIHENPVNWQDVYSDDAVFYQTHVEPSIAASLDEGHYGIYFAPLEHPGQYDDIRSMVRKKLSLLPQTNCRFLRIEVPIHGELNPKKGLLADDEKTCACLNVRLKRTFAKKVAQLIFDRMPFLSS